MKSRYIAASRARKSNNGLLKLWQVAIITTLLVGGGVVFGLSQVNSENRTAARVVSDASEMFKTGRPQLPDSISMNSKSAQGLTAKPVGTAPPRPTPSPSPKPSASPTPVASPPSSPSPTPPPTPVVTEFTPIPSVTGYSKSHPFDVAVDGRVVGNLYSSGVPIAFSWTSVGGTQVLGALPGSNYSQAFGVNSNGKVVGVSNLPSHTAGDAVMYFQGAFTALDPNAQSSEGLDINEAGTMVGWRYAPSAARARVWTSPTDFFDLGTLPGGNSSYGRAINELGSVAGEASVSQTITHAFLWKAGEPIDGLIDLGVLSGGEWAYGNGINSSHQVVGTSHTVLPGSPAAVRAFKWAGVGNMVNLGVLDFPTTNYELSVAEDINDAGYVVGWSGSVDVPCDWDPVPECNNAVLWGPTGVIYDLNQLYPQSNWHYATANAISNSGYIVGQGYLNGNLTGYRLKIAQ